MAPSPDDPAAHAEETVLGLDNVPLDLPIAGVGSRLLAGFLDYLVLTFVGVAWVVAVIFLGVAAKLGSGVALAIGIVGYFVIDYGYFAGLEIARGRTLGKSILDLRVATRSGGRPGTAALLLRNAVRTVDVLIGVPLMAIDPLARRIGDRLAGTVVLHRPPNSRGLTLERVPEGWGPQEIALLESFLDRAREMEPRRREALGQRFLDAIARTDPRFLEGHSTSGDPVLVLRRLVRGTGGRSRG